MKLKEILLGLLHSGKYYEEEVRKARGKYYKQFDSSEQAKTDLDGVPVSGIIGELKGESNAQEEQEEH